MIVSTYAGFGHGPLSGADPRREEKLLCDRGRSSDQQRTGTWASDSAQRQRMLPLWELAWRDLTVRRVVCSLGGPKNSAGALSGTVQSPKGNAC